MCIHMQYGLTGPVVTGPRAASVPESLSLPLCHQHAGPGGRSTDQPSLSNSRLQIWYVWIDCKICRMPQCRSGTRPHVYPARKKNLWSISSICAGQPPPSSQSLADQSHVLGVALDPGKTQKFTVHLCKSSFLWEIGRISLFWFGKPVGGME